MFRILLSAAILLGAASTPLAARAATPSQLKSVKIDLPDSDKMFPDGPGSDAINNNCLACHSADMVLNQPALSKQAWAARVLSATWSNASSRCWAICASSGWRTVTCSTATFWWTHPVR